MQPAISFAIREKLYEVSFFIAWLMYHVRKLYCIEVISVTLYTRTYIDCNSKCSFNKGNQDEQEGSPGVWVYSSQVSITLISYLICFDERFYFVVKIPTYSCHNVFLWSIFFSFLSLLINWSSVKEVLQQWTWSNYLVRNLVLFGESV